ncbi:hypothetical protein Mgra_00006963 [Meloidogyne graminicola]|uniref:Uncharacterized protein n=1 Tax=Meloidogyne graminicola TaxID=189291 RepID=A0A8S9ZKE5_9BILA|nr:hypothetical protein Mgra_00006963 [Meloidogyne graminicola]
MENNSLILNNTLLINSNITLIISYIFVLFELILLHPFVIIISNLNIYILLTTKVLHQNMSIILIVQSCSIIGFEIFRNIAIIEELIICDIYYPGSIIIQKFIFFFVLIRNMVGHILLIERLLGTFFYKCYENYKKIYFSISWISFIVILAIGIYNKNKYNECLPKGNNYSLSEKYQLSENIRTSKQLIPIFFCHFFNGCVVLLFGIFIFFELFNTQHLSILKIIATVISSFVDFIIEITVITHHPQLKKSFFQIISKLFLFKIITNNKIEQIELKQIDENKQRSYSINTIKFKGKSDHHFNMLKNAWQ